MKECNGNTVTRQKDSVQYLRQLRKKANEQKSQTCEEDTQRNRECKDCERFRKLFLEGRHATIAKLLWITVSQPMTVMHSCADLAGSSIQCLYLILIQLPFRVCREVLSTGTGIISAKEYSKQEIQNRVSLMKSLIYYHWYSTGISLVVQYFGMKASLQKNICQ